MSQLVWGESYLGNAGHLQGIGDLGCDLPTVCRQLMLASNDYVTGGWTLGVADTQLSIVKAVKLRLGKDPMGRAVANTGLLPVVTIIGDKPKLQFYRKNDAGNVVEATNAVALGTGTQCIWLEFSGVQ